MPDPRVTVKLTASVAHDESRHKSLTIRHAGLIRLTPGEPLSLDAAFRLTGDVQRFFTLMVGEPVYVRKLRVRHKVRDANARAKAGRRKLHDNACDVFFLQPDLPAAKESMRTR